jgi:hypothetical protein
MPVLHSRENRPDPTRIKEARILELTKIVKLAKDQGMTIASLIKYTGSLSKLELMLLDSAFKEMNLDSADKTLLILPEQYTEILQKLTVLIAHTLCRTK